MRPNKSDAIRSVSGPIAIFDHKRPIVLHCAERFKHEQRHLEIDLELRPADLQFKSDRIRLIFLRFNVCARFPGGNVVQVLPRRELGDKNVQLARGFSSETQSGLLFGPKIAERAIEFAGQLAVQRKKQRQDSSTPVRALIEISGETGDSQQDAVWYLRFVAPKQWAKWRSYGESGVRDALDEFRGWERLSAIAEIPTRASTSVSVVIDSESIFVLYLGSSQGWWGQFFASVWVTRSARKHFRNLVSSYGDKPVVSCELNAEARDAGRPS